MWAREGLIRQSLYAFETLDEREEVRLQLGQNLQQQNHILASSLLLQGASGLLEIPTDSYCHLLAVLQQPWGQSREFSQASSWIKAWVVAIIFSVTWPTWFFEDKVWKLWCVCRKLHRREVGWWFCVTWCSRAVKQLPILKTASVCKC